MSKFLCLGMELGDVVRAPTEAPAKALRREGLATVRPGSVGEGVGSYQATPLGIGLIPTGEDAGGFSKHAP